MKKSEKIEAPPGVFDIIPEDSQDPWKASWRWQALEKILRSFAENYGFKEIRTPLFERKELFVESVGESSDIVTKEMYLFEDRGGRTLCLRPEGTAPCVRAFIEHNLAQLAKESRLFYLAPMFRYERMQAGRYRQHHQFGVELFGSSSSMAEIELISLAFQIFNRLGIKNIAVQINSLGSSDSRARYREALIQYLKDYFEKLSPDSQTRFEKNPLRILDSKDGQDQAIIEKAPRLNEFLDTESIRHNQLIIEGLNDLKIPVIINPLLVRGLDYYQKTVFEFTSEALGAQNTICGGGRYDGLIARMGGPDLPSAGFGMGMERLLQVMLKQELSLASAKKPDLYIVPMGELAEKKAMALAFHLREKELYVLVDHDGAKKVGKALARASNLGSAFACVLGDNEIDKGIAEVKELFGERKIPIPLDNFASAFEQLKKNDV